MNAKPDGIRDESVRELSDQYSFYLARWAHGRTPLWARGAFDPRDLVRDTLAEVAQEMEMNGPEHGHDKAFLGRLRRTLYDNLLERVRKVRDEVSTGLEQTVPQSAEHSRHDLVLGNDLLERYEAGLQRLSPVDREAIIARAELGLPWSEVTELLEKPGVAAARMTVSRALVRLAREMSYER
jgi:DNA-directed RNA polymerase specialized sigma24 family protein